MSRTAAVRGRLRRRPARTVPALAAAAVLLGAGLAAAWLGLARLAQGAWPAPVQGAARWLAALAWDSPPVWGAGAAAVAAGMALLLCAAVPGRFTALTVHGPVRAAAGDGPGTTERETVMTRRAVARLARAQCLQTDGAASATAAATGARVHLKVKTPCGRPATCAHASSTASPPGWRPQAWTRSPASPPRSSPRADTPGRPGAP